MLQKQTEREGADHIMMSGIALQHGNDGHSRCVNSGGSFIRSTVIIYSTSMVREVAYFRGYGQCRGLKVVKLSS